MDATEANREERVKALIRAGELEVSGENQAEVEAYFAPDFAFHAPDGAELDYDACRTTSRRCEPRSMIWRSGAGSWSSRATTSPARR